MKRLGKRSLIVADLGLVALFAASIAGYVAASTTTGGGKIREFEGVQVSTLPDSACTSAFLNFVEMPGMSLTFKGKGAVVVMFQGQFGGFESTADAPVAIRFTIDGNIVGSAFAIGNDHGQGLQTFGFNAFSEPLAQGTHELKVQWHTSPGGATSCVEERSLILLRNSPIGSATFAQLRSSCPSSRRK